MQRARRPQTGAADLPPGPWAGAAVRQGAVPALFRTPGSRENHVIRDSCGSYPDNEYEIKPQLSENELGVQADRVAAHMPGPGPGSPAGPPGL